MKKILLGTTTLIGAAALFAGSAMADTPKVTVGGYTNFEAGYMDDDVRGRTVGGTVYNQKSTAFRQDTQVAFRIDGKNDSGMGYGGEISLLADSTADVQGRGSNASKAFIYMDGGWGRFELGSNVGADSTMKVDAATIARATGGINGDFNYFANATTQFLAQAALPMAYGNMGSHVPIAGAAAGGRNFMGNHSEENVNKVTYYTPRWNGLQVGVSFMPDEINRGQGLAGALANPLGPNRAENRAGLSKNIFTGGINYDTKFGDWGFTVAGTGEWGSAENKLYEDLAAWNAGAKVSYMGWSFAGSYGDWGDSNTAKAANSNDTWYWNVGLAYEYGPFGASLTYLNSQFDCGTAADAGVGAVGGTTFNCATAVAGSLGENKLDTISAGVDYKLAPGLTPYAEFTWYDQNAPVATTDNKGYVGIIGTQLNF